MLGCSNGCPSSAWSRNSVNASFLASSFSALSLSFAGGKAAAIAYTLVETAKLNAVDPHAWLADTLARIPDHKITKVDDLLPWRWNG